VRGGAYRRHRISGRRGGKALLSICRIPGGPREASRRRRFQHDGGRRG
jgi:hypothetical protein